MAEPPILTLRDARVTFGGAPVFDHVDVSLGRGERTCLVGRNGSGKSTLMKALVGEIELDAGERFEQPGLRVAWLPQDPPFAPGTTAYDYVAATGLPDHEIGAALDFVQIAPGRRAETLSGGEKRRVAIAQAFAGRPDVLLLDEPTNHLDLAAIEWLERTLNAFTGAALIVSHDRTFLTNVTNRTWWLAKGVMRSTDRGFAHFDKWSEEVLEAEAKAAERLDAKLAQETRWLLRGVTARRKRNQGRLRKLEEMRAQRAAFLGGRRGTGKMQAEEGDIRSKLVIEAKHIRKAYPTDTAEGGGELVLVRDFTTRVLRGDRIGILGPNGAGKTTLLRMLIGELEPDAGSVRVAKHLNLAYFDQHRAALDPKKSLWETLCPGGGDQVFVHGQARHVRAYLKDFLFDPRQAESPVASLSGGERNRLMLSKILATPSELLVLDEPTNDLDMDTLDLLQEMLSDYAGTLLLISHDRDFLDRTVTSVIAMEGDGHATEYAGGYSDYARQRQGKPDGGRAGAGSASRSKTEAPREQPRARRQLSYKDRRELDQLPERMAKLEEAVAKLEAVLADPTLYQRNPDRFHEATARLEEARKALERAETRWLELEAEREALETGAAR